MSICKRIQPAALLSGMLLPALVAGPARAAAAADNTAADSSGGRLQEVVVTATRRQESESKVPISISAFTQAQLDQNTVRDIDDLARLTPGLQFSRSSDASGLTLYVSIRGVQSDAGSGATGIYIDDTPIQIRASFSGMGSSVFPQIFDLQRVEVLRGPQGTLFGAGSEGGTIRFITPQPSTTAYDFYARSDLAFTQDGSPSDEIGAACNLPLIQGVLGMRVSASYRHDGGYVNRIDYLTGNVEQPDSNYFDTETARIAFTLKPLENLTFEPSFFYQSQYDNDASVFWIPYSDSGAGVFNNSSTIPNVGHDRFQLSALKAEWALPGVTLSSNTSYFARNQPITQNLAFFEADVWANTPYYPAGMYAPEYQQILQRNFTQEFRVQSQDPSARLTWQAGVFYQNNFQHAQQVVQDTFLPGLIEQAFGESVVQFLGSNLYDGLYTVVIDPFNTVDRQIAVFGQADYRILPKLTATVGLRDERSTSSAHVFYAGPVVGPTPRIAAGSESAHPLTPKYGLQYQITDGTMAYASASKGFRQGGYNNPVAVNCGVSTTGAPIPGTDLGDVGLTDRPNTFNSDSLWSYEIGSKMRGLEGRLAVDASVYLIKWNDIQFSYNLPHCGFSFTTNAGNATSKGFELSVQARPIDPLQLAIAIGRVDAYYDNSSYFGNPPAPGSLAITGAGDRLEVAPWTVALQAEYSFRALEHTSYFRVNYSWSDGINHELPFMDPNVGGYDSMLPGLPTMTDVELKLGTYFGNLDAALYVDNLTNDHPLINVQHATAGDPLLMAATVRPRTAGITASYRF